MSERTDNETSDDVAFAAIGARYAMPALAAVEAKAREILDGDVAPRKNRPAKQKSASLKPSARKPTPPPFDPIVAHDAASERDETTAASDAELIAKRARLKRQEADKEKSEAAPDESTDKRNGASTDSAQAPAGATPDMPPKTPTPPGPKPAAAQKSEPADAEEQEEAESPWHEEIFDESWTTLEPRSAGYHAREDIRFLVKYCKVPRNGKILDVACGAGRHAMEMASAGYHVVGIDRSRGYLQKAVEEANRSDLKIKFVEGDMRAFSLPPSFDAVTSLHTSFGYFSDRENLKALRCMGSSIAPGGQLILDVVNRDWVASIGARRLWWEHRGFLVMEDVIFRDNSGHLEVERTVVGENSPRWDQKFRVRLYTVSEYVEMFRTLGLELIDVTGNLAHPGVYLGASNHRMILRARKPAE